MQIVIPMSGFGERFRRAGYEVPKPLIEVEGKPMIAHVVDMFPGERDFIFICNRDHLQHPDYGMESILRRHCPEGKVVGIAPHKLGPVHAVCQAERMLALDAPVLVNYCDFTCYWDWRHFREFVAKSGCWGAIPAYRGFHPHSLGSTNYAYMREENGWVRDIQEKQPYTSNRMEEYASSGTYYFASGRDMVGAFRSMMEQRQRIGDEYYVSLAYKSALAAGKGVAVYPLQHFMQWGTPEDLAEYRNWSVAFRRLSAPRPRDHPVKGTLIMPMAGLGSRFVKEGYRTPKPLIPVSGKPMVAQALCSLPAPYRTVFVVRGDMHGHEKIVEELKRLQPGAVARLVSEVTEGQACTTLLGLDTLEETGQTVGPITVGTCDSGALYDMKAFDEMASNPDVDVIVWGVRGHANAVRHPEMFGWIEADERGRVKRIAVKEPLGSPAKDPVVLGTFTFRSGGQLREAISRLVARNGRVNGEFYMDSCINDAIDLGMHCRLFLTDSFLSWGTPDDLRTFEYWQSCFDKWPAHPYRLELDGMVEPDVLPSLKLACQRVVPDLPAN